jgi:hypothetical protein
MYGNGFEQRHEGSFLATYNAPGRWGVTANTRIIRESSDHLTISTLDISAPSVTYQLPRERELDNATFSLWFVPFRDLTVSGSYGLLRNSADQGVLFAGTQAASAAPTNYTSQAQLYSRQDYTGFGTTDLSLCLATGTLEIHAGGLIRPRGVRSSGFPGPKRGRSPCRPAVNTCLRRMFPVSSITAIGTTMTRAMDH